MSRVLEKFLRYVAVDTMSADDKEQVPSTPGQFALARLLVQELEAMGAANVRLDEEHCYVYATIPSNVEKKVPALGFIAHMDTSPEVSGANVKPRMIAQYDGKDILLQPDGSYVLSPADYPELLCYTGKTLVVTDGTTLLGGDDKAGVAEIMALAEYLLSHPEIKHGTLQLGFTPDEEVGRGVDFFDVQGFRADYAYTVDGGAAGELEYENFNAAAARLTVSGISVHPGDARGKMLNAVLLAMEFQSLLPVYETPAATQAYEGFYHPGSIHGSVDQVVVDYIIRDHDSGKFRQKKAYFEKAADFLNEKYGKKLFTVELRDSYYNMKEKVKPHWHLIDNAVKAMELAGVEPKIQPIRGGTDGARLSFMGLPCPNLGTGGHNFHGRYEYVCVEEMEQTVEILGHIVRLYAEGAVD